MHSLLDNYQNHQTLQACKMAAATGHVARFSAAAACSTTCSTSAATRETTTPGRN